MLLHVGWETVEEIKKLTGFAYSPEISYLSPCCLIRNAGVLAPVTPGRTVMPRGLRDTRSFPPLMLMAVSTYRRLPGFGRSSRPRRSWCLKGRGPWVHGGPKTGWAPRHVALPHQTRAAFGTLSWAPWQLWWPLCSTCSILWYPRVIGDELIYRQLLMSCPSCLPLRPCLPLVGNSSGLWASLCI